MAPNRDEIEKLLHLSDEQVYALLVPEVEASQLYSPGAKSARGKEIFNQLCRATKTKICDEFHRNGTGLTSSIDLVALVIAALLGTPTLGGVSLVAFAVLVVKTGLPSLCGKPNNGKGD